MLDIVIKDWLWDPLGAVGYGLFNARLLVQLFSSEKAKRPVLPISYWYMSITGAVILIAYALHLGSWAVLLPNIVGVFLYSRNLQMELRFRRREKWLLDCGMKSDDYPWPSVSVIIPARDEEELLPRTLESLSDQDYAGKSQTIVALNGCADASAEVAAKFDVQVVESEKSGMGFAKNFGASSADGEVLIFVDADTLLPADGIRKIVESLHGHESAVATVAGKPDRGGGVVRGGFMLANHRARQNRLHAPGGIIAMHRTVFDKSGGFDETIELGSSSDFIFRARSSGADYILVDAFCAATSIRRFAESGIFGQLRDWQERDRKFISNIL